MDEQGPLKQAQLAATVVSRRTINLGAAWSVPVIVGALAAPAAAGSPVLDPASASLATASARKGISVDGNRQVSFTLVFANVTGSNTVVITAVTDGPWSTLPTAGVTVTSASPSASFLLSRPDNNSVMHVDVTYTVNGITRIANNVRIDPEANVK